MSELSNAQDVSRISEMVLLYKHPTDKPATESLLDSLRCNGTLCFHLKRLNLAHIAFTCYNNEACESRCN